MRAVFEKYSGDKGMYLEATDEFVTARARASQTYGKLPLSFEANSGQVDSVVKFLCRGEGHTLFLTPTEAVLSLRAGRHETAVVRMRLAGGNSRPRMVGVSPLPTKSNYFRGNDPRHWHIGVTNYEQIRVEGVYPGVDLVYRGNQRQLEYDLVIAPNADPRQIRLAFHGTDTVTMGVQGELILHTASGDLVQHAPAVYQEAGKRRKPIEGHYILLAVPKGAARQVGFVLGRYDRARPLIIDPVLGYSTFLGGSGSDYANGIAVDSSGNAYVTGSTDSTTFPGINGTSIQPTNAGGASDAFVTKINATGTAIIYSTFLGGMGGIGGFDGPSYDVATSIAVDGSGNAYVTGGTTSTTFPGISASSIQPTNGGRGLSDAFVTKINAAGNAIVYSTFLGGDGNDHATGIAVDSFGNAYVTGGTDSTTFPGVNGTSIQPTNGGRGLSDAFVVKINASGTAIVYSTFLGGDGNDQATGIAVDGSGNAYVTGVTSSATFPGVGASSIQPAYAGGGPVGGDGFVTKINATGTAIVYSTFLGGSGSEYATGIAVDSSGNAYVTGETDSTTFPGVNGTSIQPTNGGHYDGFVTKINATGTAIIYSTFLGGSGFDEANSVAVDGSGNAYVTGRTDSKTFPGVSATSIQPTNGGGYYEGFVTKINATGTAIVYSTFLGSSASDLGTRIALDGSGNAYVIGITDSTTFPGVSGTSIQPTNGGGIWDSFVTKIRFSTCTPGEEILCLNDGRFQVQATFDARSSGSGQAHAVSLNGDTGYFWFFNPSNVEIVIKILNGCSIGGHFWVFAGGLTNVEVILTVTDTQSGAVRTYTNPQNTAFLPIQDTSAFTSCP